MNLKRILTSVIGLPIMILILVFGNEYLIAGVALIASIICTYEYYKVISKVCKPIRWVGYLSNILVILVQFFNTDLINRYVIFIIPIILLMLFMQVIITDMKTTFKDVAYSLLGCVYIPFFLVFIVLLRKLDNGKVLMGYIFAVSWSTDIFAYLIGRNFGKHYFSKISPKKTIEGTIAGILGAILIICLYTFIVNKFTGVDYSYIKIGIIGLILSILSQIGDFVASTIKRFVDIKDYGTILPGHGGILDRIDSLLFIAPFAYMIFTLL